MHSLPMASGQPQPPPPGPGGDVPSLADLFAPPGPAAVERPATKEDPDEGGVGGETSLSPPEVRRKVESVLEELRPYIRADGGDIQLVSVEDGVVKVRLHGACETCSVSIYTLQLGVERRLREEIPEIKLVEAV